MKNFYRSFLFCNLLSLLFTGCSEDTNPILLCGSVNPVKNLDWLKQEIDEIESTDIGRETFYISRSRYKGETVFVKASCCQLCNYQIVFFNCEGEQVQGLGLMDFEEMDWKLVWKSSSNQCEFD